jgi:DNA-binding NtrC family response regulator
MLDTLLVIEDESLLGNELARHYRGQGWEVNRASTLEEARRLLFQQLAEPLVVLSDMSLPDGNALDLLEQARAKASCSEWCFLTGYGTVADSVRALRLGAYDFVEKPCELDRLDMLVEGAARSARAQRRLRDETDHRHRKYTPDAFVGSSTAVKQLRSMIMQLAKVPFSSLVITGETGTGKGLTARILHYSGSRSNGPLIELNCAALPRELMESELFGYEAGAFTGAKKRHRGLLEQAHKGTLFLDEIAEMDLDLQGKLLKAVEELRIRRLGAEHEIDVDVQIIAATNHDLLQRVENGQFRRDLYHRLSLFTLHLPPLRERKEDLHDLIPLFIDECNAKAGKKVTDTPDSVWRLLEAYDWPGNVRELHNAIERCVLLANGEALPQQWLQLPNLPSSPTPAARLQASEGIVLPLDGSLSLEDMERFIIEQVLHKTDHNVTAAAKMLGTTRETLRYRVQKYNL